MNWNQNYAPIEGNIGWSALLAAIPLAVLFVSLALLRIKSYWATLVALGVALALSLLVWGMPVKLALLAAGQGAAFGLFPVFYIVLAAVFLHKITVQSGQFEIIRASLASITPDRRLQALLIAFCFGAFLEGAAGFGTPVAIAGATLVGLGFRPLTAAGLCLLANTAPVAFGGIGIPIVALGGVMGLNDAGLMKLSTMVGRQLPFISLFIPLYLILVMAGVKKSLEVLPAAIVCGAAFALSQWATASYLGPYLPDILASVFSIVALVLFLKFWQPATIYRFDYDPPVAAVSHGYTFRQMVRAWSPYLALTVLVLVWGLPAVKGMLDHTTLSIPVTGLDGAIIKTNPTLSDGATQGMPIPAKFKFDYLATTGTAIVVGAVLSAYILGLGARETGGLVVKTLSEMRLPLVTIVAVLALAYLMNASGMTTTLGILLTRTGVLFPLVSPVLGWLGVFLTGSDTSSNVLFGGLQKATAEQLGLNPILTAAANTSGGVVGKMISPQSLAIACAATGLEREEGSLFRFTLRHSLLLLVVVVVIVYLQATCLAWMVPV